MSSRVKHSLAIMAIGGVFCAGCGDLPSSDGPTPHPNGAINARLAEEALRDLAAVVLGSPEDWRAAEMLEYASFHAPIARCMTETGFDYRYPPMLSQFAARTHAALPDTYSAIAELPNDDGLIPNVAADMAARAETAARYAGPVYTDPPSDAYADELEICIDGESPSQMPPEWPIPSVTLTSAFQSLMNSVASRQDVTAALSRYPACMANAGFEVASQDELYD
jgi:hypothetical protein